MLVSDWDEFQDWLSRSGKDILVIIALTLVAYLVFRAVFPPIARRAILGKNPQDPELIRRADTIINVTQRTAGGVFFLIGLLTVLPEMGVDVTALLAGLGITGLAIALGAQTLVKDGISGVFLLAEDQYRTGDVIRIADTTGTVEAITLRRTIIRDADGVVHSVPNGAITVVANYTRDYARINLPVQVAYAEQVSKVEEIITRVGAGLSADEVYGRSLLDVPASAGVEAVTPGSITLMVTARTVPSARRQVEVELRRRLHEAFVDEGVKVSGSEP
jgi:small conductance mechanosensitive channel